MSSSVSPSLKYLVVRIGAQVRERQDCNRAVAAGTVRPDRRRNRRRWLCAQRRHHLRTAGESIVGRPLQEPAHGVPDGGRNLRARVGDGRRRIGETPGDYGLRRRAGEGDLARQHFEHHAAQREEVAAPVEVAARGLLGAHVGRGANGHADLREHQAGRCRRRHQRLADPEVGHHGVAFVEQDVLWLDVAVDDVAPMRVVEGISHLHGDADRFVHGQW